jgi:hypothetical protein
MVKGITGIIQKAADKTSLRIKKLDKEIKNVERQILNWEFAGQDDSDHDHVRLAELIEERDKLTGKKEL